MRQKRLRRAAGMFQLVGQVEMVHRATLRVAFGVGGSQREFLGLDWILGDDRHGLGILGGQSPITGGCQPFNVQRCRANISKGRFI